VPVRSSRGLSGSGALAVEEETLSIPVSWALGMRVAEELRGAAADGAIEHSPQGALHDRKKTSN